MRVKPPCQNLLLVVCRCWLLPVGGLKRVGHVVCENRAEADCWVKEKTRHESTHDHARHSGSGQGVTAVRDAGAAVGVSVYASLTFASKQASKLRAQRHNSRAYFLN